MGGDDVNNLIAAGREALKHGAWQDARASFETAVFEKETPEALEGLAEAVWWLHDEAATFDARERAYRLYQTRGDSAAAARMALWLATDSVEFRGEPAVASGWLQRARRLLEGIDPVAEHGWLAVWEAHLVLMLDNDTATARRLGAQGAELGRSLGAVDVEMLGLAVEGLALVSEGQIAEGMRRLDEAAAAALAGEIVDLNAAGTALCYLMTACERIRDYTRAAQWCQRVRQWAAMTRFEALVAVCRPHYAMVLMWRGAWEEAEAELTAARRDISAMRPPMAVEAIVRLAELRWRQGLWDEAAELFAEVEQEGLAQLGQAELALDHGDPGTAIDLADRFLRRIPVEDRMERAAGLEIMARALIAAADPDRAVDFLAELRSIAKMVGTDPLQASANMVQGLLAEAKGDRETARRWLEDAVDLFERNDAPFDAGRARIALARVLHRLGKDVAAAREASAALIGFRRIGALRAAQDAELLLQEIGAAVRQPVEAALAPDGLTPREVELLRLIAAGKSNREIADHLVLSIRTVERHISNIYEKIGASGKVARATATAFAFSRGLVPAPTH